MVCQTCLLKQRQGQTELTGVRSLHEIPFLSFSLCKLLVKQFQVCGNLCCVCAAGYITTWKTARFSWRRWKARGGSKLTKSSSCERRYIKLGSHVVFHQIWWIPAEFIKSCHYLVYLKYVPILWFWWFICYKKLGLYCHPSLGGASIANRLRLLKGALRLLGNRAVLVLLCTCKVWSMEYSVKLDYGHLAKRGQVEILTVGIKSPVWSHMYQRWAAARGCPDKHH